MSSKAGRRPKAKGKEYQPQQIPYSEPQTELDQNVRNVLLQLTKHLGAITFTLAPVETLNDGMVCWDVQQKPDLSFEITVWWLKDDAKKAG